jgi:hypothetical protein
MVTPGRNTPCVCGSGKKYKKCCGSGLRSEAAIADPAATIAARSALAATRRKIDTRAPPSLHANFAATALRGAPTEFLNGVGKLNGLLAQLWQLFGSAHDLSVTTGLRDRAEDLPHQVRSASITSLHLQGVRLITLLNDFVDALGRSRLLSAALAARAAIETAADAAYLAQKVEAALGKPAASQLGAILFELRRSMFGSRFPWVQVTGEDESAFRDALQAFATGRQKELADSLQSTNVLTLMKALDLRFQTRGGQPGYVQMVYEHLSDFVHPSAGTAVAFLRPAELPGSTRVSAETGPRVLGTFWCMMGNAVAPICEAGITAAIENFEKVMGTFSQQGRAGSVH